MKSIMKEIIWEIRAALAMQLLSMILDIWPDKNRDVIMAIRDMADAIMKAKP